MASLALVASVAAVPAAPKPTPSGKPLVESVSKGHLLFGFPRESPNQSPEQTPPGDV